MTMNSIEILHGLNAVAADSTKTGKQTLLSEYLKDDQFRDVVQYALDPFVNYGVRPGRYTGFAGNFNFTNQTFKLLDDLSTRALTGNAAAAAIEAEFKRLDIDSAELLWRVLNKDLRAGFSESTCNKIVKGMFKSFPYMRCSLMSDVDLNTWDWANGIISQEKADGQYTNFNNVNGITAGVVLQGRSGEKLPYEGFERIHQLVAQLSTGSQTHGELVVIAPDGSVCPREIGNGMINKVRQGGHWAPGHTPRMLVWDQIPLEAVQPKGKYEVGYVTRLRELSKQVQVIGDPQIQVIETRIVRSLQDAFAHYLSILEKGGEGTIIKRLDLIWQDHTSKGQIKLKLEARCELRVKGYKEGKEGKKTADTFGSLALESEDGYLKVNCSGMSDDLRKAINDDREGHLDLVVSVTFNGIMYPKRGKLNASLFLPRLDEIRSDKTVADTFEEIEKQVLNAIDKVRAQALAKS